jgi:hypothetical protein
MEDNSFTLIIEHVNDYGEVVISPKINSEVLKELKVMCEAALDQIEKFTIGNDSFRNY